MIYVYHSGRICNDRLVFILTPQRSLQICPMHPSYSPYRPVSSCCSFHVRFWGMRSRCRNNSSSSNTLQQRQQPLIAAVLVQVPTNGICSLSRQVPRCGSASSSGLFFFSLPTARQSLPSQLLPLLYYYCCDLSLQSRGCPVASYDSSTYTAARAASACGLLHQPHT